MKIHTHTYIATAGGYSRFRSCESSSTVAYLPDVRSRYRRSRYYLEYLPEYTFRRCSALPVNFQTATEWLNKTISKFILDFDLFVEIIEYNAL